MRDKLGRFVKGNKGFWKDKNRSDLDKQKMSEGHKRNPTRYWLGKELSKSHREKMSVSHKGKTTWIIGLTKETDERVKKISEKVSKTFKRLSKEGKLNQYKNLGEIRKGKNHPMYGKPHKNKNKNYKELYGEEKSEKIKEKVRKARAKQILPIKDTKIEVKIQNFLKTLGIEFFTHQYMKINHAYQCDILIPYLNLVIECDGDYWHKYPIGNDIDHIRTKELIQKGFKVLRLWEFEINKMSIDTFKNKLESFK